MNGEFFPIVSGLVLGSIFSVSRFQRYKSLLCTVAGLFGFLAAWSNGELHVSWLYLFADIPLALFSALAVCFVAPRLSARYSRPHLTIR